MKDRARPKTHADCAMEALTGGHGKLGLQRRERVAFTGRGNIKAKIHLRTGSAAVVALFAAGILPCIGFSPSTLQSSVSGAAGKAGALCYTPGHLHICTGSAHGRTPSGVCAVQMAVSQRPGMFKRCPHLHANAVPELLTAQRSAWSTSYSHTPLTMHRRHIFPMANSGRISATRTRKDRSRRAGGARCRRARLVGVASGQENSDRLHSAGQRQDLQAASIGLFSTASCCGRTDRQEQPHGG